MIARDDSAPPPTDGVANPVWAGTISLLFLRSFRDLPKGRAIESVTSDRITVRLAADDLKKLESGFAPERKGIPGAHPSRP